MKIVNKIITVIMLILVVTIIGCNKNIRGVSSSSILKENDAVVIMKIQNNTVAELDRIDIFVNGYDIRNDNIPQIAKIWSFVKYGNVHYLKLIVPAGKYRFEQIKALSSDPSLGTNTHSGIDLEYIPRYSFYVIKGKINFLGTIYLIRTNKQDGLGVMKMHGSSVNKSVFYQLRQKFDLLTLRNFKKDYPELVRQTSGVRQQQIIMRSWNRQFKHSDPLARSPQFQNGYKRLKWKYLFQVAKNILENSYDIPKLEVISQYRFIDKTNVSETVAYDMNAAKKIKYPVGGLYKITVIRNKSFDKVIEEFKNLYGTYNKDNGKYVWRLINNRITVEPYAGNRTRITIVSMEYIRKVMSYKRSLMSTFRPTEFQAPAASTQE